MLVTAYHESVIVSSEPKYYCAVNDRNAKAVVCPLIAYKFRRLVLLFLALPEPMY